MSFPLSAWQKCWMLNRTLNSKSLLEEDVAVWICAQHRTQVSLAAETWVHPSADCTQTYTVFFSKILLATADWPAIKALKSLCVISIKAQSTLLNAEMPWRSDKQCQRQSPKCSVQWMWNFSAAMFYSVCMYIDVTTSLSRTCKMILIHLSTDIIHRCLRS